MDTLLENAERIIVSITDTGETVMLSKERCEQVRQLHAGKVSIAEIGRRLDIDRKTVRKMVREAWRPYEREARADTLLATHDAFLRRRAGQVNYSARILYQELQRDCGIRAVMRPSSGS